MNVMYGYTAAGFTGRMPCADIADAIISTAKNLLYQSIQTLEKTTPDHFTVIYGDTDSVFLLMQHLSVEEAFAASRPLVRDLNARLDVPLELKFEKVYSSFVSFSKKRYAGIRLESPDSKGEFESKGLEDIRTDSFKLLQAFFRRALESSLRERNLSRLKAMYQDVVHGMVGLTSTERARSACRTSSSCGASRTRSTRTRCPPRCSTRRTWVWTKWPSRSRATTSSTSSSTASGSAEPTRRY